MDRIVNDRLDGRVVVTNARLVSNLNQRFMVRFNLSREGITQLKASTMVEAICSSNRLVIQTQVTDGHFIVVLGNLANRDLFINKVSTVNEYDIFREAFVYQQATGRNGSRFLLANVNRSLFASNSTKNTNLSIEPIHYD